MILSEDDEMNLFLRSESSLIHIDFPDIVGPNDHGKWMLKFH